MDFATAGAEGSRAHAGLLFSRKKKVIQSNAKRIVKMLFTAV